MHSTPEAPRPEHGPENDHQVRPAMYRLVREVWPSAPSLSEFPCSLSSGSSRSFAASRTSCPSWCSGRLHSARKAPWHEHGPKNDYQVRPAMHRLVRELLPSAPSLFEFPCSSSSGSSPSLLPAELAAQAGALDDCTPLENRPGTSVAPKMIIKFALQCTLGARGVALCAKPL